MLEFDAGVIGRELPVGFGVMGIAISLPSGDLVDEDLLVGDAAVPACAKVSAHPISKVDRLEIFVLTVTERIAILERRLVCHRRRLANSRARRKAQR